MSPCPHISWQISQQSFHHVPHCISWLWVSFLQRVTNITQTHREGLLPNWPSAQETKTWRQSGSCQSCGTLSDVNNLEHSNMFSSGLLCFVDAKSYRQWDHLERTLTFSDFPRRELCATNIAAIHVSSGCRMYKSSCNSSFWFGPGQRNP